MNQFSILSSQVNLMDQLSDTVFAGNPLALECGTGSITLTTPTSAFRDRPGPSQLCNAKFPGNAAFPQPSPNTLYFVFLGGRCTGDWGRVALTARDVAGGGGRGVVGGGGRVLQRHAQTASVA